MKLRWAECAAQKARREAEEKAQEEAKRQRVTEKERRKRRTMEYLQQLQDEVLEEEAALLEGADVVATTRHSRTNDLTTSKALSRAIK